MRTKNMKLINFRIEEEMADWLKDYAECQNTYISEVIRYAISQLKIHEEKKVRDGKSVSNQIDAVGEFIR